MIKKIYFLFLKYIKPVKYMKKKGAKIGKNFVIHPPFKLTEGDLIEIGDNCNFSSNISFFTHDGSNIVTENLGISKKGWRKYGKITIGNNVFAGGSVIFLPGVTIGNNVIIGAGSVVTKSFPSNVVIAGNPAKIINTLDNFIKKNVSTFISPDDYKKLI